MLPYNLGIEYALDSSLECFLLILITTACNKSVKEVTRPFEKLHFLYLQTVLTKLIKQPGPAS